MLQELNLILNRYWHFYCQYFSDHWQHMTPIKYGVLLMLIGVAGWVLMRKGPKAL